MSAALAPSPSARVLVPEWLDTLPADDPRARRSRADLRRINRITGACGSLGRALDAIVRGGQATHLVELGAGDGSLMQRLAQRYAARWPALRVALLDRQPSVAAATRAAIESRGWRVDVVSADVFDWLRAPPARAAIVMANLFVHHFEDAQVAALFRGVAAHARAFVCCEPRRSAFALFGSRCLGAVGCNDVTRHDAVASIRAGFCGRELSALWPDDAAFDLHERAAGPFLHCFSAVRRERLR